MDCQSPFLHTLPSRVCLFLKSHISCLADIRSYPFSPSPWIPHKFNHRADFFKFSILTIYLLKILQSFSSQNSGNMDASDVSRLKELLIGYTSLQIDVHKLFPRLELQVRNYACSENHFCLVSRFLFFVARNWLNSLLKLNSNNIVHSSSATVMILS